MFCLMISEQDDSAMSGPYIGQVDTVPLQHADGSPVLDATGQPVVVKLQVVASSAGAAPEPTGELQQ
jgi:hypothetical protein